MRTRRRRITWFALVVALAVGALAACGSSSSSGAAAGSANSSGAAAGSANSSGTVALNVGTGTPIKLPKGPLKIGLFLQTTGTAFDQSLVAAATAEAKKFGYKVTVVVPANASLNAQIDQIQTAAQNHTYNVMGVQPLVASSECAAITKTIPAAGVLAFTLGTPCETNLKQAGEDLWVPGTLATVAGDTTLTYSEAFLEKAAKMNPGPQQVALITGPQDDPLVINEKKAVQQIASAYPNFHIVSFVYGDWSTPTAFSVTQAYLQGHPNITLVLSAYSPDVTRGVIQALQSLGKLGKLKVADQGASAYTIQQIKAGNIEFSIPYFPDEYGTQFINAVHDAQMGKAVPRFISNVPAQYGTVENPTVITKANVSSFQPRY